MRKLFGSMKAAQSFLSRPPPSIPSGVFDAPNYSNTLNPQQITSARKNFEAKLVTIQERKQKLAEAHKELDPNMRAKLQEALRKQDLEALLGLAAAKAHVADLHMSDVVKPPLALLVAKQKDPALFPKQWRILCDAGAVATEKYKARLKSAGNAFGHSDRWICVLLCAVLDRNVPALKLVYRECTFLRHGTRGFSPLVAAAQLKRWAMGVELLKLGAKHGREVFFRAVAAFNDPVLFRRVVQLQRPTLGEQLGMWRTVNHLGAHESLKILCEPALQLEFVTTVTDDERKPAYTCYHVAVMKIRPARPPSHVPRSTGKDGFGGQQDEKVAETLNGWWPPVKEGTADRAACLHTAHRYVRRHTPAIEILRMNTQLLLMKLHQHGVNGANYLAQKHLFPFLQWSVRNALVELPCNEAGLTPLHVAAVEGDGAGVLQLVKMGASPYALAVRDDKSLCTPVQNAQAAGNESIRKCLEAVCTSPCCTNMPKPCTSIGQAIERSTTVSVDHLRCVKHFYKLGAVRSQKAGVKARAREVQSHVADLAKGGHFTTSTMLLGDAECPSKPVTLQAIVEAAADEFPDQPGIVSLKRDVQCRVEEALTKCLVDQTVRQMNPTADTIKLCCQLIQKKADPNTRVGGHSILSLVCAKPRVTNHHALVRTLLQAKAIA